MSDPKPYTLEDLDKELSPYGGARGDALAHYMGDLEPLRVLATVEALGSVTRERDEARRWLSVQHDAAADHPHMHTFGRHEHSCTLTRLHAMRVALDVAERCVEERDALKAALREIVDETSGWALHGSECPRFEECDESSTDDPCWRHAPDLDGPQTDECPTCECGVTELQSKVQRAREALGEVES